MSYLRLPDPHPGRCRNTRQHDMGNGQFKALRCLDYEGTKHVCSFPPQIVVEARDWVGNTYSHKAEEPNPWVKPTMRKAIP